MIVFMATLQQSGRSGNIGITPEVRFDNVSLVVARCRDDIHARRITELSVFDTSHLESSGGVISLDAPVGRTYPLRTPFSTLLEPMFTTPYQLYPFESKPTDTLINTPNDAVVDSRHRLDQLLGLGSDDLRRPAHVFIGTDAFQEFLRSAIDQLDFASQTLDTTDNGGVPMLSGDDFLCLRLAQSADQAGIAVTQMLSPAHVDRALEAFVLTTYTHNYRTLSSIDGLGNSGTWHSGAQRFARAYGVVADEIADLALMHNERILELIALQSDRHKSHRPEYEMLEEGPARRMAHYLVDSQ